MNNSKSVCIIGGGVAGLYIAKYLSPFIPVTIFEKEKDILGHYRYCQNLKRSSFDKIVKDKNIKLITNKEFTTADLSKNYLAYVIATGGLPKTPLGQSKSALSIIQNIFHNDYFDVGRNLIIVGLGNVTCDLLKWVRNKVDSVTVISRSSFMNSPFDNLNLAEVIDDYNTNFDDINKTANGKDRKMKRRENLVNRSPNFIQKYFSFKPKLKFIENCQIKNVSYDSIEFIKNNEFVKLVADDTISSIGFIPNKSLNIQSKVPVYELGWRNDAVGDINVVRRDAINLSEKILSEI